MPDIKQEEFSFTVTVTRDDLQEQFPDTWRNLTDEFMSDVVADMEINYQEGNFKNELDLSLDIVYERYKKEHKCIDDGVVLCAECGRNPADLPGDLCPGCAAYEEHRYSY